VSGSAASILVAGRNSQVPRRTISATHTKYNSKGHPIKVDREGYRLSTTELTDKYITQNLEYIYLTSVN
jgi:hypothetical protein